jgi:hypothetical protein
MPQGIVITGFGAVTPVGAGARQSGAAVRAGIRRAREWPDVYACLPPSPGFDEVGSRGAA